MSLVLNRIFFRALIFILVLLTLLLTHSCQTFTQKNNKSFYLTKDSLTTERLLNFADTCYNLKMANDTNLVAGQLLTKLIRSGVSSKGLLIHWARFLNNKGVFLSIFKADKSELLTYAQALSVAELAGDDKILASINNNLAYYFLNNNELALATTYYQYSIQYINKIEDKKDLAYAYKNLATIAVQEKDFEKALILSQKAISLVRAQDNEGKELTASCLNNIGAIYIFQNKYELAMTYFIKSESLLEQSSNFYELINTLQNKGNTYHHLHKNDSAEYYLKRAYQLSDSLNITEQIHLTSNALLSFYEALNKKDKIQALNKHLQQADTFQVNSPNIASIEIDTLSFKAIKQSYKDSLISVLNYN